MKQGFPNPHERFRVNRITSLLIVIALLLPILTSCSKPAETLSAAELLDLGEKYLLELNYEQAVVCFTSVIEIEPKNVRAYVGRGNAYVLWNEQLDFAKSDYEKAIEIDDKCSDGYLGLVDVYIRLNEFDKALEIAELGYTKTGNDTLKAKIDEIKSGNINDASNQPRKKTGYYNGALAWYHIYTYDKGKQTGVTAYDAGGSETGHVATLYDEEGRQIQDATYAINDGILIRTKSTYDDSGKMIRIDMFHSSTEDRPNGWQDYQTFEYNGDGQLTKRSLYTYGYDNNGNQEGSFQLREYWVNTYDDNGNQISQIGYDSDDKEIEYSKFDNGRLVEQVRSWNEGDGVKADKIEYVYDENGKRLYFVHTDAEGNVTRIEE
ncbi:Prokaryotic membrane lipoprotein lipid attachment site profile [Desulfitobacterium hafniense]|uniref:Prokaryotic membrane lipoprotein lipid attachment site profile n=1 Tax=Desulfitobacterium hafniense TaxID=49338 RepID=A0A098B7W5_DESHA|nr:hypothetical protein [Desulfitobacterium hafniense]CDX04954.1 Prokaryotic membrane lipoprotein lipid attachment site profile [Desulfitobacterium hafniense]